MKIFLNKREQGSVLVTGLIISLVAGIALASCLTLISNRYRMTVRSMDWNKAMPVLESGLEEALTHLNDDSSLTANGWTAATLAGFPVVAKQRNFPDGTYFKTYIYNGGSAAPRIYSSGFVPVPLGKGYISRTVMITAARSSEFTNAIAASGLITESGGLVDSYSSCNGAYSSSNSMSGLASVSTSYNGQPAIKMSGSAEINGTVSVGGGGTISLTGGAAIGDSSYLAGTGTGPETPTWTNDLFDQSFPTNSPPTNSSAWLTPPTVTNVTTISGLTNTGITSATVLSGGDYTESSFTSGDSAHPMLITGPSTLYVTGDFTVQGSGYVEILPGGSLTLIVGGSTTTISGGGVVNGTGLPEDFSYIGLTSNTSITYSGSASFDGTINAPQANFTISGSGDAFGAAIVKNYTNTGGAKFHYDSCLPGQGPLMLSSWKEIQNF